MNENGLESLNKIKDNTDADGFLKCDIAGANFVFRPLVGSTIKSIQGLVDYFQDELIEEYNTFPLTNKQILSCINGLEYEGKEVELVPYYEIAVNSPVGDYYITVKFTEDTDHLSVYDIDYIETIDDIRISKVGDKNYYKLKINGIPYETKAPGTEASKYQYEFDELNMRETKLNVFNTVPKDGWYLTEIDELDVNDCEVHLRTEEFNDTTWRFEKPVSWKIDDNKFVQLANEFGTSDISEMEGSEVYIRYCSKDRETSKFDKTGTLQILCTWEEITKDSTNSECNENKSFIKRLISFIF